MNTPLTDDELDKRYQDFLDEIHGPVMIGGYEYQTSHALKEVDPTAYRCGFADWLDIECRDGSVIEVDGVYFDKDTYEENEE